MTKGIRESRRFNSSSSPGKSYAAILYEDWSTSCNCPGWTRRVADDGTRECKHTRKLKEQFPQARSRTEPYRSPQSVNVSVPANTPVTIRASGGTQVTVSSKPAAERIKRKFDFEE